MSRFYGWRPQAPDHRDKAFEVPTLTLPSKVDLRMNQYMPPVYDQGQLGSCTANAIGGAYEYELRRQSEDFMPSRLWIYYQERVIEGTVDQDAGAEIRDGLKVASQGVPPETDWPYDISTFTGPPPTKAVQDAQKSKAISYFALTVGSPGAPLRACLAAGFPFVFGFSVPESLESDDMASGKQTLLRLPGHDEQIVGGHATVAVGYDWTCSYYPMPVFTVRNSWGSSWCADGYFAIDYRYFNSLATDLWTIRQTT